MEYPKLPPTSPLEPWIRVFILQPATDRDAPLMGTLENYMITFKVVNKYKFRRQVLTADYEALSYVWGSPAGSRPITVDGQSLPITNNCEEALRHLRLPAKARRLWVDAICINQKKVLEKNDQVKLMGDIYRAAKQTIVWLGPALLGTEKFFSKATMSTPLFKTVKFFDRGKSSSHALAKQLGLDTPEMLAVAIANATAEWFTRTWTIQEMALSSNIIVMRGLHKISWLRFTEILQLLASVVSQGSKNQRPEFKQFSSAVKGLEMRLAIKDICYKPYKAYVPIKDDDDYITKSLITLLFGTLCNNSTNPMDKVFGFYGLFPQPDPRIKFPRISYLDDWKIMYMEFATTIMKITNSLWILLFLDDRQKSLLDDLPSWVPDWSQPLGKRAGPLSGHLTAKNWKTFNYGPQYIVKHEYLTLTVHGIVIDTVKSVSKPWCIEPSNGEDSPNDALEDSGDLFSWLGFVFDDSGTTGKTAQNRWQAFLEVITVGTTSTPASLEKAFPTNIVDLILKNLHPLQKLPLAELLAPLRDIIAQHSWCTIPRRLIRTTDGRLGLCTARAAGGEREKVILLVGCPEPVLLKKSWLTGYGFDWEIVGIAVVEGMSGGRGWEIKMKEGMGVEELKIG